MLAASARSTQRKRTAPMRYMKTHQQTPASLFRPAACYRFRLLPIHFEPERLPHRGRARQLPGAPLRRSTSPDARCSMKVSVHEFHSFIASVCTHQCKEHSNSCPLRQYNLVIVPSRKHPCSPISPFLRLLLHRRMLYFARWLARG
jgi:hypothetical protein